MIERVLKSVMLLAAIAMLQAPALADDTDVFASTTPAKPANILLIFDNGASFSASTTTLCGISAPSGATPGTVQVGASVSNATKLSGTAGGLEQCAMYGALSALAPAANVNIGIMMFNAQGNKIFDPSTGTFTGSCNGGSGGCLVLPMRNWNSTVKEHTLEWVRQWTNNSGNYNVKGPSSISSGGIMQEAYAFFMGKTGVSTVTYPALNADCGGNYIIYIGNSFVNNTAPADQTNDKGPRQPLFGISGGAGVSVANPPATDDEKNFNVKYVGVKKAGPYDITLGKDPKQMSCKSGNTTSINWGSTSGSGAAGSEGSGVFGINWAKYLHAEHGIPTTTIGLLSDTCNPYYSTFLDAVGKAGGREFIPTNDYDGLKYAVQGALSSIIATNSVFASVSLPVSVNMQNQYDNQVFIGMFRPDSNFHPRWMGNLKQYQMAFSSTNSSTLQLVDADKKAAVNANNGFISECARSFWSPTSPDDYWSLSPSGACTGVAAYPDATAAQLNKSNYPDGNIVEKGAQAYVMRNQPTPSTSRIVKTCGSSMANCAGTTGGTGFALSDFNTSLSPPLFGLGSTDTATRDNYVKWARGENVQTDETAAPVASTAARPSIHGDVLHSRPVAIDYGAGTGVVVYYGANDGMLHAVNGNQTASIVSNGATYAAGQELWAFMPPEFYKKIGSLYDNSSYVWYKGTPVTTAIPKPYGIDGPFSTVKGDFGGATKQYLFAPMRRGGRAIYAFDVTTPASPTLVWKKGCATESTASPTTDCTTSGDSNQAFYSSIGQTWAPAKPIFTSQFGATKALLLMGGGYDTCEDLDDGTKNNNCASSSKGNYVYVIDASNGAIVRAFPTVSPYTGSAARGVLAEPNVVNGANGTAQYAYIADLGGVVYRIDFTGNATTDWKMTPIAKLGCADPTTGCSANRKFMFQPSVVSPDNGNTFYVLLGTGDREKPTTQYTSATRVGNLFFMVKDIPASSSWLSGACGTGKDYLCQSSLVDNTSGAADVSTAKGYYFALAATEQVVTSAVTQFGVTSFSTHTPFTSTNSCAASGLGKTKVYNVNYADGTGIKGSGTNGGATNRWAYVAGDGLPPSPVAGTVIIDGKSVPFCIGCSPDSPLEAKKSEAISAVARAKSRLYWYIEKK